jgi:hypothetical protein
MLVTVNRQIQVCTYIGVYWSYFDFHLLLISCPVPAGVVSLCRNTLVNADPLPAWPSLALMTWELAAIPCSHVRRLDIHRGTETT